MFYQCSSLEEINFNNFNTSKVTSMEAMFADCSNLKSLDLSNFDTSNVGVMNYMFYYCTSLEYLDISNFGTSQVTKSSYMFNDVKPLKYINLYNAKIEEIQSQIQSIINNDTIVCQNGEIFSNVKNDCSIFIQSDNYIIVKYGTNTTYGANSFTNIDSRKQIQYIKYKDEIVNLTKQFTIEANTNIEIYFSEPITSLNSFFSGYYNDDT